MKSIPKEYLLLFNAISDAEEILNQLRETLIAAQQQAEDLYLSIPGVILSQLLMQTIASALWALTMYSTLSAMTSLEGRE